MKPLAHRHVVNVVLDDDAKRAAQYLAALASHTSVSAALRQAVKEEAMRKGWQPAEKVNDLHCQPERP